MNVPMLYVNPITGPFAGRHWVCYVCHFGSAPVVAVFIKPDYPDDVRTIRAVQSLTEKHGSLRAFVVYLSGPDPALEKRLQRMQQNRVCYLPLTVLPDQKSVGSIYKTLPIWREAKTAFMLYRGRQTTEIFHDLSLEEHPASIIQQQLDELKNMNRLDAVMLTGGPGSTDKARPEHRATFEDLANATSALVHRPE